MANSLSNLKLVTAKRSTTLNPIAARRAKFCSKISEQIALAEALAKGESYVVKKLRKVKDEETGSRKTVETEKNIKQWWWVAEGGRICLSLRYGSREIAIAKGKNAIEVNNGDELITALTVIRKAVEDGELDTQLELAAKASKAGFKK